MHNACAIGTGQGNLKFCPYLVTKNEGNITTWDVYDTSAALNARPFMSLFLLFKRKLETFVANYMGAKKTQNKTIIVSERKFFSTCFAHNLSLSTFARQDVDHSINFKDIGVKIDIIT